ncbi:hypothetical protein NG796_07300 [Laspinema sp. A4]|uniref:hypothetical protein n=1 Tax=Laspinema sp. D2d TaxID=2953686 RepID=UPI0021BAAF80|nr:hypothetical protein [Laspinema sp. D2d]MCT7983095.1 hypothetical protein [Laspinema sp. D2d]
MTLPWLPPNIKPLNRLHVSDGLLIDAERWRLAHDYHRHRQNAHFQSLNQPGIVSDMGVRLIDPPNDVPSQYRDKRWVQVQPGIAIDLFGNLIVIPEPIDFRITSMALMGKPLMVYLVVSYVDPDGLVREENGTADIVTESFRIDEKNSPPAEWEVELCRILLQPGEVELATALDAWFPGVNNLDLRYRPQVNARTQAVVRLAQVVKNTPEDAQIYANLAYLSQAIAGLYPVWQGLNEIGQFTLNSSSEINDLITYDVLYFKTQPSLSLSAGEFDLLRQYIDMGGVLLVEASIKGSKVEELMGLQHQLQEAIARVEMSLSIPTEPNETPGKTASTSRQEQRANQLEIQQSLQEELISIKSALSEEINTLSSAFKKFARDLGIPLEDLDILSRNHPLRTQPFLFSALPTVNGQALKILSGGGIIILIGNLSAAWGLDEKLSLGRETIRTAQEMGINILHYARTRRQLTQLQKAKEFPPTQVPDSI